MTGRVLFCVAEEAKPFVRKVMNHIFDIPFVPAKQSPGCQKGSFYLIQSRECPSERSEFKRGLEEDQSFESKFIGASVQDCQDWMMENQGANNFMDRDIIVVADTRSARDETLLISVYNGEGIYFESDEITLPQKPNTWYDFRVEYRFADQVFIDLYYGPREINWFQYYLHKEQYTDEHGVFDVAKASPWGIESLEKAKTSK